MSKACGSPTDSGQLLQLDFERVGVVLDEPCQGFPVLFDPAPPHIWPRQTCPLESASSTP